MTVLDSANTLTNTQQQLRYGDTQQNMSGEATFVEDREIIIDDDTVHVKDFITPSLLHECASNGNKKQLQDCILSGEFDINGVDNMGRTPLIYSVLVEQIECVNLLLKHGANIDKPDSDGRTALHWAAYQGNHKLVKLIISKCKNKSSCDKEGMTPLHLSMSHDNIKVMQIILKYLREEEVDAADFRDMTALCWSVSYERIEHTKLLLRYGASMDSLDNEGRSILHWTSQNKTSTLIKMLLQEGTSTSIVNFEDKEGRTLLHMAVGHGNYDIVQYLLTSAKNIDVNKRDGIMRSPLHWAAVLGHTDIVELLLNNGADYLLPDSNGGRALHYAAQNNHKDVVRAMAETARVTDEPDKEKTTALMWAALKGNVDVLKVLLESKCCNINGVDVNRKTALHMSCQTGNLECVKVLIEHRADINMVDHQHHIPLFYACASGHADIVSLLLHQENQKNLHERDLEGRTPLHCAAMVDRIGIIKILIQHGLDPNAQDNSGCPPLHFAAYGGLVHCMNVLLENKAKVDTQDQDGVTALHMASRTGNLDAVKLLVTRYNAKINILDNSENRLTCLNYAILHDHHDVTFFLIENGACTSDQIQELAIKIQAIWRGYNVRKHLKVARNHFRRQSTASSTIVNQNLYQEPLEANRNITRQFTPLGTLNVGSSLPPVSPTHQVVPRALSHTGMSSGRPRANTPLSATSGISSRSSHLLPDKYGDSRQGPKFTDVGANPFSLNRVARVKSPVPERRMNHMATPRAKSITGVISTTKQKHNSPKNSTGNFPSLTHHSIMNFSSRSSTSSSEYISNRTDRKPKLSSNKTKKNSLQDRQQLNRYNKKKYENHSGSSESTYFQTHSNRQPLPQISLTTDQSSDTTSVLSTEIAESNTTTINNARLLPRPPPQPRKNSATVYKRDENINKPWNVYRRDQKRINIIRMKTNAAIKIQTSYRAYRVRKSSRSLSNERMEVDEDNNRYEQASSSSSSKTTEELEDNDNISYFGSETDSIETVLSTDDIPDQDTLQEIAALVIQATWRQYVKAKLICEANSRRNSLEDEEEEEPTGDELVRTSTPMEFDYTYNVVKKRKQRRTSRERHDSTNDEMDSSSAPKNNNHRTKTKNGKPKLMPSKSFPLMENIYREKFRVKRNKRFSIKKRLLQRTNTTVDGQHSTPLSLDQFTKTEIDALKAGKPKLVLVGRNNRVDNVTDQS